MVTTATMLAAMKIDLINIQHLREHLLDGEKYFWNEQILHLHLNRTKCLLVASHHDAKDLEGGELDDTYKAKNPFQSTLSDCSIVNSDPDKDFSRRL